jgi:hypothetical protein
MRQPHEKIEDLTRYRGTHLSLIQLSEAINVPRRTLYYHVEKGALKVVKRLGVICAIVTNSITPLP